MVSLLCDPNEELEARERSLLASLVNACVKKASGLSICPKEKSDPDATIKSVFFVFSLSLIPELFSHFPHINERQLAEGKEFEPA